MSSRWDSLISARAWVELVALYRDAGGEDADDHTLAEILRQRVLEVEG